MPLGRARRRAYRCRQLAAGIPHVQPMDFGVVAHGELVYKGIRPNVGERACRRRLEPNRDVPFGKGVLPFLQVQHPEEAGAVGKRTGLPFVGLTLLPRLAGIRTPREKTAGLSTSVEFIILCVDIVSVVLQPRIEVGAFGPNAVDHPKVGGAELV